MRAQSLSAWRPSARTLVNGRGKGMNRECGHRARGANKQPCASQGISRGIGTFLLYCRTKVTAILDSFSASGLRDHGPVRRPRPSARTYQGVGSRGDRSSHSAYLRTALWARNRSTLSLGLPCVQHVVLTTQSCCRSVSTTTIAVSRLEPCLVVGPYPVSSTGVLVLCRKISCGYRGRPRSSNSSRSAARTRACRVLSLPTTR